MYDNISDKFSNNEIIKILRRCVYEGFVTDLWIKLTFQLAL